MSAPPAAGGAKTVPLTQTAAAASKEEAAESAKAAGAAALPKATIKLQPTAKPTGTAAQAVPTRVAPTISSDDYDEEEDSLLTPLAAVALVLAAAFLLVQLFSWPAFSPAVDKVPGTESWKIPKMDSHAWQQPDGSVRPIE